MEKERVFFKDFWDPKKPLNPQLPYQEEIRRFFVYKKEKTSICIEGQNLEVEYSVIQPKIETCNKTQNLVIAFGNTSLIDNNIVAVYPFLASYLEKIKSSFCPLPLRIICISQYGTSLNKELYRAKTLDESGLIFTETLKKIVQNKGPIEQIVAHSLGTIILASALKYAAYEKSLLSTRLFFDRGPSSIELASYKKLGNLAGWVTWKLAQFSGWDIDLGLEIKKHLAHHPSRNIFISEVAQDGHFGGIALGSSLHLKECRAKNLTFDFADQLQHTHAHHNLHCGFLDGHHLVPRNFKLLKNNETIPSLLMKPFAQSSPLTYLRSIF